MQPGHHRTVPRRPLAPWKQLARSALLLAAAALSFLVATSAARAASCPRSAPCAASGASAPAVLDDSSGSQSHDGCLLDSAFQSLSSSGGCLLNTASPVLIAPSSLSFPIITLGIPTSNPYYAGVTVSPGQTTGSGRTIQGDPATTYLQNSGVGSPAGAVAVRVLPVSGSMAYAGPPPSQQLAQPPVQEQNSAPLALVPMPVAPAPAGPTAPAAAAVQPQTPASQPSSAAASLGPPPGHSPFGQFAPFGFPSFLGALPGTASQSTGTVAANSAQPALAAAVPVVFLPGVMLPPLTDAGGACAILQTMQQDITNGSTPGQALTQDLVGSSLYLNAIYQALLQRDASQSEGSAWASAVAQHTVRDALAQILSSSEFYSGPAGGTDQSYVASVDAILLARPAGANDPAPAGDLSDAGQRSQFVQSILDSGGYDTVLVQSLAQGLLHRAPPGPGAAVSTPALQSGSGIEDLIQQLIDQGMPASGGSSDRSQTAMSLLKMVLNDPSLACGG